MSCSDPIGRSVRVASTAVGLGALALLALSGCAGAPETGPIALTPTEHYGIQVTSRPEQIAIGVHADGLSANQKAALGQFVAQWRDDGGGMVRVSLPASGVGGRPARMMGDQTMAQLAQLGVPAERLQLSTYVATAAPQAAILASYERFEARGPNCSGGWGDMTATRNNTVFGHFGCAVTANIASEVANPRDFLAPAVMTPADASRREVVLGKYRTGDTTSSSSDSQASGKVSDATQ